MQQVRAAVVDYMRTSLGVAMRFELEQNWPNPFNPSTAIRFTLPETVPTARLRIVNTLGQIVWEREFGALAAGPCTATWDGRTTAGAAVSSGVYIYELTAGGYRSAKRMTLIK